MDKQAYQYGFNSVCSKLGIDAKELIKASADLPTLGEQTTGRRALRGAGIGAGVGAAAAGSIGAIASAVLIRALGRIHGVPVGPSVLTGSAILGGLVGSPLGIPGGATSGAAIGALNKPSLKDRARGALGTLSQKLQ